MKLRDYLEQAQAVSNKYTSIDIGTEGLRLGIRVFRKFFSIAARVNPLYFGTSANLVVVAGVGWTYPAEAEALWRIEQAGAEVLTVPHDDPQADTSRPALLFLGRTFTPAGNVLDPVLDSALTGFYAQRFPAPPDVDTEITALWNVQHDALPIAELAIHLALKDGRTAEIPGLVAERDDHLRLFAAHLEHAVSIEVRRWATLRAIHTNTLVPLSQLLAGGSSVNL